MLGEQAARIHAEAGLQRGAFGGGSIEAEKSAGGTIPVAARAVLAVALGALGRHRSWMPRSFRSITARRAQQQGASAPKPGMIMQLASTFCNLFAVWLTIAAVLAVKHPSSFTWIPNNAFTALLGLLMFSVGITTTLDDFRACFSKPGAIAINFLACYGIMPALAYILGKFINADPGILAGLVLVGAINGGQASNLCTLIANGDVALSVLMTTSTTLGCIVMTPLLCKLALGAAIPIDALGIVYSTFQVVLGPIFLGVIANSLAPGLCMALKPFSPVVGVLSTVLLVAASVAKCAQPILNAGSPLQFACLALHLVGGLLGYFATKYIAGYNEKTCRTVAIETAMKSSAFAYLLATNHFGLFSARVPPAVSVVWMAITGSLLAVYWKGVPATE
jgi:BASS family bile acid:Na+ symporter